MTGSRTFPVRVEPIHLMLPPDPGKDHGPALCGATNPHTALFRRNVTCRACKALLNAPSEGTAP